MNKALPSMQARSDSPWIAYFGRVTISSTTWAGLYGGRPKDAWDQYYFGSNASTLTDDVSLFGDLQLLQGPGRRPETARRVRQQHLGARLGVKVSCPQPGKMSHQHNNGDDDF